jgi:hypothetical protein
MRTISSAAAALAVLAAVPAAAQYGRGGGAERTAFTVEPYAAYGFYGSLPDGGARLDAAPAFGVKGGLKLSPGFGLTATYQNSRPRVEGGSRATLEHYSVGVQFDYAPREGAEGIPPVSLEAGIGQVRYEGSGAFGLFRTEAADLAANVGIGSGIRLGRSFAITYGVNDWISNWQGDRGMVNQVFARVGAQIRF